MYKRPIGVVLSGLIVLVAGFAHLRPLLRGAWQVLLAPNPRWIILLVLSASVLLEVILLLQLRRRAIQIAIVLSLLWIAVIVSRIMIALQYSPAVFGPGPTGMKAYLAPVIAAILCVINILYLTRPAFRNQAAAYRKEREDYERNLEKRLLDSL